MSTAEEMVTGVVTTHTDLSIIGLIMGADIIVKIVLLILLASSIWSWAIIIDKSLLLKKLAKRMNDFEEIFWSGQMLDQLYNRVRHKTDNPYAAVFVAAMDEWNKQPIHENKNVASYLSVGLKERMFQAMNISKNRELEQLDKNLSFLSIVGSSATFVGVFGTVWGIMTSFKSIAAAQNASLSVVAPGIAEALFATAIGLVAAIPAMIFYNLLSDKINRMDTKIEDFASELGSLLSQEIDRGMQHGNDN